MFFRRVTVIALTFAVIRNGLDDSALRPGDSSDR